MALEYSLIGNKIDEAIQDSDSFLYLEFDVQETYDHKLVIFHDTFLRRMIPNKGYNKKVYNRILRSKTFKKRYPIWLRSKKYLTIAHFTLKELQQLRLKGEGNQRVPTYRNFLAQAKALGLRKPMAIEIKNIGSKKAKENLISIASEFHQDYMEATHIGFAPRYEMPFKVRFLAFPHTLCKTFGPWKKSRMKWCKKIINANLFGVFKPGKHNNQCLE